MIYNASTEYIERELAKVSEQDRPAKRLEIDLADILTGPTSFGTARNIAANAVRVDAADLARAMIEAGTRYLQSIDSKDTE